MRPGAPGGVEAKERRACPGDWSVALGKGVRVRAVPMRRGRVVACKGQGEKAVDPAGPQEREPT